MEGLRQQALASLNLLAFLPNPTEHELVTFTPTFGAFSRESLPLPDILKRFESPTTLPTFRLVKLQMNYAHVPRAYEPPPTITVSKDDILHCWKTFNLDPVPLQLLGQTVWDSNHFACATWDPQAEAFYFTMASLNTYFLTWTYHPKTKSTTALIIIRTEPGGRNDWEDWFTTLRLQTKVVEHALCLFLTSMVEVMQRIYKNTLQCHAFINETGTRTGYNPWLLYEGRGRVGF